METKSKLRPMVLGAIVLLGFAALLFLAMLMGTTLITEVMME